MSDETPSLESLLPAEVVAEIRAVIARRLSQDPPPQATIGAKASLILEANVVRPRPAALATSTASVDPEYLLRALLNDPELIKKSWASPDGVTAISSIGSMIAAFLMAGLLVEQRQEMTALQKQAAASQKAAIEQIEQFWLAHKDVPTPTPNPQPGTLGD
jgi:hypothetical protein